MCEQNATSIGFFTLWRTEYLCTVDDERLASRQQQRAPNSLAIFIECEKCTVNKIDSIKHVLAEVKPTKSVYTELKLWKGTAFNVL